MVKSTITGNIINPSAPISGDLNSDNSISGNVIAGGGGRLLTNTTAGWNANPRLVASANTVYVYTDHHFTEQGQPVPGFKVGDGTTYLIDLPFNDDLMMRHINDTQIHITQAEREFWNNKNRAFIAGENLVLTDL